MDQEGEVHRIPVVAVLASEEKHYSGIATTEYICKIAVHDREVIKKGTKHYYGSDFLEPGMKVKLIKEPDNDFLSVYTFIQAPWRREERKEGA